MSFSRMDQNRNKKSSGIHKTCGSFLSRHRPDAQVALQQSPILQNDMDKLMRMGYNVNCEVKPLRPFTQLNEQTPNLSLLLTIYIILVSRLYISYCISELNNDGCFVFVNLFAVTSIASFDSSTPIQFLPNS